MADESDETVKPPALVWLTTQQVKAAYGFDPTPYLTAREPAIKSKLAAVVIEGEGVMLRRVWLATDVESHPQANEGE